MMLIDVGKVMRERMPAYSRFIPGFVVGWIEKMICQDGLNRLLSHNSALEGVDFAEGVLRDLNVTYGVKGEVDPSDKRVILVSNHPLGGLDGLVLASLTRRLYGDDPGVKFVVNDLLTFVEPLRSIFIGINKHGAQSKEASRKLDRAFEGDGPIVMFPAGLVSRRHDDGSVSDLQWHKMVVNKAISTHRDIIPLHFSGMNSCFFYKFARLRSRLGLRFNVEMIRLPREVFLQKGARFGITIGSPVRWETLKGGKDALSQAAELREAVYRLAEPQNI